MQIVVFITPFSLVKTVSNSACSSAVFHITPGRLEFLRYGHCEAFYSLHCLLFRKESRVKQEEHLSIINAHRYEILTLPDKVKHGKYNVVSTTLIFPIRYFKLTSLICLDIYLL
jgi:hypothetical protein